MRILIAEEDSILADGVVRALRQSGYAIDHVRDGSELGLAIVREIPTMHDGTLTIDDNVYQVLPPRRLARAHQSADA